ncbi:MAG TPA: hypothetical protein VLF20_06510 [Patescibacteria group bacterium]|nr:hypothetical protein [Patescibacteria group bacterium]
MELLEKIKEKVEEIHEGIQNLKSRTNFESLLHKNRLLEVETGIDQFRDHNEIEGLRHSLDIFKQTAILVREGSKAYDETIWDANVAVKGKMTILDSLFSELDELVYKYIRER